MDVLKVGHHTSVPLSDVFLDQLHPQLALISVGKKIATSILIKNCLIVYERSIYLRTDERGAIR